MTEASAATPSTELTAPPTRAGGSADDWPTMRQAYFAAGALAAAQMCAQLNNGVMTLMVEPVKRDLGLTDLQMSYLLGFSVVLFYAVVGIPAARLVDRHNRKWLLVGSIAVWSAATAACGLASTFWQFFVARFGIGAGESIQGPLSYSLLADYFRPERLSRGIAIYNIGLQGGLALSLLLGAFLINVLAGLPTIVVPGFGEVRDWQLVFAATGLVGLPIALLVMLTREPARRGVRIAPFPGRGANAATLRQVVRYLARDWRLYLPMFLGLSFTSIHMTGLAAWNAAFFSRTYGWEPATVGLYAGLLNLVLALPALYGAVRVNEHFARRGNPDANLRVMAIGITVAVPFTIGMPLMPSPWLALAFGAIGPALMLVTLPSLNTALQIVTPNEMRGQVTAIYLFIMMAAGGAIGPTMMAFLTQVVFADEAMLRYAIAVSAAVFFTAAALAYWTGIGSYRARILELRGKGIPV